MFCYFLHTKIAQMHAYTLSVYVIIVSMNVRNLLNTLQIFISSLFIFTKSCIIIFNNLYIVKYLVHTQILSSCVINISKVDTLTKCHENKAASIRKYLDHYFNWYLNNLMFRSEKSNETLRSQNTSLVKHLNINISKKWAHRSPISTKLKMNYKISLTKVGIFW